MYGATDPHGLPVISITLQSTKKTNVVLQSAPESCTIIRKSQQMDKYFFNSVLRPFQDYFSSRARRWAKTGDSREKNTWHTRSWLVSHVASAGLEPTPDTEDKY